MSRVLIVSARLPVSLARDEHGSVVLQPSVGGLATGLKPLHESSGSWWIGWPGVTRESTLWAEAEVAPVLEAARLIPVDLSAPEEDEFYGDVANGVLWPLFHYLTEQIPLTVGGWDGYEAINARFADAVAAAYQPGDIIWVHDYQLALLPAMLRHRCPGARIGFFLHIPFPAPDVFGILPQRAALLEGIFGADVIGVHTHAYVRNLLEAARRFLGLKPALERVRIGDREVHVGVYPMGVDAAGLSERASRPEIRDAAEEIRPPDGPALLLGIDRLDYTKGIPRRLLAFEQLLARHPDLREHVRLVQVAVPSRTRVQAYQRFRAQVDRLVGRINGRFSTPTWTPVSYLYRSIPDGELLALFRAADVMLVTPVRDGMNLVAKEFVAARSDGDGVLVLSEFTGASDELAGALRINPYDVPGSAEAYHAALSMPEQERARRMHLLRARVLAHNSRRWADEFLDAVRDAPVTAPATTPLTRDEVVARARTSPNLRLLLDYDGTLVSFTNRPADARPDAALLQLLRRLAARPHTEVHIVSGRDRADLDTWLGSLPVGLHAEHGLWSRRAPAGEWRRNAKPQLTWRPAVLDVMRRFTERTPGSTLEEKSVGIAWHYRQVEPELANWQVNELHLHLAHMLADHPAEVLDGNQVVEVRPHGVHKGISALAVASASPPDALLVAMGDDRTDEQLFSALPEGGIAVAVGTRIAGGDLRLSDPAAARAFLEDVART